MTERVADFVVCPRVRQVRPDLLVPGSIQATCSICGHAVWVAPSSQEAAGTTPIACSACALRLPAEGGNDE